MKKFNSSLLAAAFLTGTVVLSSCSSDELPVGNEVQQLATESAMTFSFSAPAVMGDEADTRVFEIGESSIDSRFSDSENIYVYLKRKDTIAYGNLPIIPSKVSEDGKSCTITAPEGFTFVSETSYTPVAGDEVYYYYGMTSNPYSAFGGYYDFSTNGTKADVEKKDFCLAEMVVKDVDMDKGKLVLGQKEDQSKEYFTFKNINSVFRQKLTFLDEKGKATTPTIGIIIISSENNKTVMKYQPFGTDAYGYDTFVIENPVLTDGSIYFSTIFNDENKNDVITFTAYDTDGNKYEVTKKLPSGGFQNNKYYYGDATLKRVFITGANSSFTGTQAGTFTHNIHDNPADITILGTTKDNAVYLLYGGTVTLDNVNAENATHFMMNSVNDLTLNLKGDNYFKSTSGNFIFSGYYKDKLYLKCEGNQATFTVVTGKLIYNFGLRGGTNLEYFNKTAYNYTGEISNDTHDGYSELQALAADDNGDNIPDYTIKRDALITNPDGTYTWKITVTKK